MMPYFLSPTVPRVPSEFRHELRISDEDGSEAEVSEDHGRQIPLGLLPR